MPYYNEIFSTDGQVRPHYEKIFNHWKKLAPKRRNELHTRSKILFSGDYAQDSLPRILIQSEFKILSQGVEQRAQAILAFLQDYCTKGSKWNRIMPAHTLHTMIERHHMTNTLRKLRPEQIAFPYGPDIIRNRAGQWRVVEDSAGILGGMGDLVKSHKILYQMIPKFRNILKVESRGVHDPLEYYARLARYYCEKAAANGGIPLLYLQPYDVEPDQETRRLAQIFSNLGIKSITTSNHLRKLEVKEGRNKGIFLKSAKKNERVGALILRAWPEGLDHSGFRFDLGKLWDSKNGDYLNELTLNFARAIRPLEMPSLTDALRAGHTWTNFSPGVQFVNDKVFGLYVDTMIRRYLKQTPIIESIRAKSVATRTQRFGWRLDSTVIRNLRRSPERYVIKQVDEDGGSGVWIGQKESKRSLSGIIEKLRDAPQKFIVQDFEHLSVLDNRIVDLRIHAHVDAEQIIVSNTPWGRANWIHANGKVNISSNGFTSPVVVLREV